MNIKIDKWGNQFKLQIYQRQRRGQSRQSFGQNEYCRTNRSYSREKNYGRDSRNRGNYNIRPYNQNNYRGRPKTTIRSKYRPNTYRQDNYRGQYRNRIERRDRNTFRDNPRRDYDRIKGRDSRERSESRSRELRQSHSRDEKWDSPRNVRNRGNRIRAKSDSESRSRSSSRVSMNRDRIRCFKC